MEKRAEKPGQAGDVGVSPETLPPPCQFKHGKGVKCQGRERYAVWLTPLPEQVVWTCALGARTIERRFHARGIALNCKLIWPVRL